METFTQCKLERPAAGGGKQIHTAFIPSNFAKIGKHVEILVDTEDGEGMWSKGWVVVERGTPVQRTVLDQQRKATSSFQKKLGR